jgi:hypothetical protein
MIMLPTPHTSAAILFVSPSKFSDSIMYDPFLACVFAFLVLFFGLLERIAKSIRAKRKAFVLF